MPSEVQPWWRSSPMWGWIVFALCVELLGYGLSQQIARSFDFGSFYAAGHILRGSAGQLYDLGRQAEVQRAYVSSQRFLPFYHLSYEALLYVPLSLVSYQAAYIAYLAWNLGLLAMAYGVAPCAVSGAMQRVPRMALFFASVPILLCLAEGQNTILYLVMLCLVWRSVERGQMATAGLLLGLGLFKLPLTVVIGVVLAVRLGRRFAAAFAGTAAGVLCLCVLMNGVAGMRAFLHLVLEAEVASGHGVQAQQAMSVIPQGMSNLSGLMYVAGARYLAPTVALGMNLGLSLLILAGCMVLVRRVSERGMAFSVAVVCALLVGQHVYLHDMALLLLPALLARGRWHAAWVALCYAIPVAIFALAGPRLIALDAIVSVLFLAAAVYEVRAQSGRKGEKAVPAQGQASGMQIV